MATTTTTPAALQLDWQPEYKALLKRSWHPDWLAEELLKDALKDPRNLKRIMSRLRREDRIQEAREIRSEREFWGGIR